MYEDDIVHVTDVGEIKILGYPRILQRYFKEGYEVAEARITVNNKAFLHVSLKGGKP